MTDFDPLGLYGRRHVEREILSALIDGELGADERRFVHEHLQDCAPCRETLEEFTHIHGMVTGLPRLVAPASFVSDVLSPPRPATRTFASRLSTRRGRWVVAGLAAAAAAITLAGLAVPPPATEPPVDAFIERHVSVHTGVEPGAQVLFAVNGR